MALSCPQERLPPAPEEGGHGDPGALELGHWGRRGEDLQTACPGGKPHLEAEPCWGGVVREKAGPAPPARATETFRGQ